VTPEQSERLRSLPAIGDLLATQEAAHWLERHPRSAVVNALREAVERARVEVLSDDRPAAAACDVPRILEWATEALARHTTPSLRRVINATGVVLHTGLGRAPLCDEAVRAIADAAGGYLNLEYELDQGRRGRRITHVADLLRGLTGAEAATVVNNNAAAVLLVMRVLCAGRQVIVSRGQLVEIGGSFRMPEVMAAGGAILREVGTTNRTRLTDFEKAVNENTVALLRVHHSNFRIVGFTADVPADDLVRCAHKRGLLAIDDLGSGAMFDLTRFGLPPEPHVGQSIAAGFDVVCFSGDKLLGGPQAGIILGRKDLILRLESHPLMRAFRVDKLVLLALEATLRHYVDPTDAIRHIPALAMMHTSTDELAERARRLEEMLSAALPDEQFFISSDESVAGAGSLPGEGLPTVVIRWQPTFAGVDPVAAALRRADPSVVTRIRDDAICFDLRTIFPDDFPTVVTAARSAAARVENP